MSNLTDPRALRDADAIKKKEKQRMDELQHQIDFEEHGGIARQPRIVRVDPKAKRPYERKTYNVRATT